MFDVNNVKINGAFYELFESTFSDDFFKILASMRSTPRLTSMRKRKVEDLTDDEKEELLSENIRIAALMKKNTGRIAYIGTKLNKKDYKCSYEDYLSFLATTDASDFQNPEIITAIWEKVNADQKVPDSVKNA